MPERTPIEPRFLDHRAIEDAMRRAVRRAVWEHKQLGQPIYALKDGRPQWIPPEEIEAEAPAEDGLRES
jgi:hypothetical protein